MPARTIMTDPHILVPRYPDSRPVFHSTQQEGKHEQQQAIDRDMKRADKAVGRALWDKRIRIGMRTDWERSALKRYEKNYEEIDWSN